MPKILLEDTFQFIRDTSTPLTESKVGALTYVKVPGTLSLCDVENGNGRMYKRSVWEANLKAGSHLKQLIEGRAAFGLLEHPKDGNVDLSSPISHAITSCDLKPDGKVTGEITILDSLPEGHKLRVFIEFGYNPLVSSRGFGSVIKEGSVDVVQDDFICEGWDVVFRPSFPQAQLTPQRESTPNRQVTESAPATNHPAQAHAKPQSATKNMEIKDIRLMTESLRGIDPTKATPKELAESISKINDLHQQLSIAQAGEPTKSWECTKLHETLSEVENRIATAMTDPQKKAVQLTETNGKLMAVAESAMKTATTYRSHLTEATRKLAAQTALFETMTERGRGWHKLAESRGKLVGGLEQQVEVSCEALDQLVETYKALQATISLNEQKLEVATAALDMLTEQYHVDTTKQAVALLELKFADKLTPELKKSLKEAKTAEDALKVQQTILGESAAPKPGAPAKKPLQESAPRQLNEITATESASMGDNSSIEECLAIANRLRKQVTV